MRTVVITGGAGGLGRALAARLREQDWHTALIDLPGPELDAIATAENQSAWPCDLTDCGQLARTCEAIRSLRPSIDMVVYNAGITHIGVFSQSDVETHRRVFEINYFAAVATARHFIEDLRHTRGTHLAISSVAGFSPLYRRTAYAASKHALEGFFASLRSEERPHGVRTIIAAPSFIATNTENPQTDDKGLARPGSASDSVDVMSPETAAEIILRGVDRNREMIPVGRVARIAWLVNRLSPATYQRLMERNMSKP